MSIGKAKRKFIDEEKLMLPGVGAYNVIHSQFTNTRGTSFARANRSITQTSHQHHSSKKLNRSLLKPGPGSYSVDLRKTEKIITFTQSKRFFSNNSVAPGPGSYKSEQCSKEKIKAGIICRSARKTVQIRENIPGPGEYTTPEIVVYKKKEPTALFGRAKRNLGEESERQFHRIYGSKQNLKRSDTQNNHGSKGIRNNTTFQRAWQGRKLQRQAKIVKKDQIGNNVQ